MSEVEALYDRGVLAEWFMRLRLEQELDRSRRAGHGLAVVLLGPRVPSGSSVSEQARVAAAAAVNASARRADLVGWLAEEHILVVIPDGEDAGTKQAAQRWVSQIWLKTMHLGALKWDAFVLANAAWYGSADELLEAASRGLETLLSPPRWQSSQSS